MEPTRLVREQPVTSKGIDIGEDVWIGAHVGIVDGVTIGDGAVIDHQFGTTDVFIILPVAQISDRYSKRYALFDASIPMLYLVWEVMQAGPVV